MKLQNNESNNEILLDVDRANALFFIYKIKKTVNFRLKLDVFNSYFFMILVLSCSFLIILKRCAQL